MKAIACINKDFGIGNKGQLLCHISEDMKFFKEITMGNPIIYGAKTLKTFPNQKPLSGRINFILTSSVFHIDGYKNWECPVYRINEYENKSDWVYDGKNIKSLEYDTTGITIKVLHNYFYTNNTRVYIVHSVNTLLKVLEILGYYDSAIICGGASIYKQLVPYCTKAYLTVTDYEGEIDAYFPDIRDNWVDSPCEYIGNTGKPQSTIFKANTALKDEKTGISYQFKEYKNLNNQYATY